MQLRHDQSVSDVGAQSRGSDVGFRYEAFTGWLVTQATTCASGSKLYTRYRRVRINHSLFRQKFRSWYTTRGASSAPGSALRHSAVYRTYWHYHRPPDTALMYVMLGSGVFCCLQRYAIFHTVTEGGRLPSNFQSLSNPKPRNARSAQECRNSRIKAPHSDSHNS